MTRDHRDDGNALLGLVIGVGISLLLFWIPIGIALWDISNGGGK